MSHVDRCVISEVIQVLWNVTFTVVIRRCPLNQVTTSIVGLSLLRNRTRVRFQYISWVILLRPSKKCDLFSPAENC